MLLDQGGASDEERISGEMWVVLEVFFCLIVSLPAVAVAAEVLAGETQANSQRFPESEQRLTN